MAVSNVLICNLALQKLGQSRIVSLDEDNSNARHCNVCFEPLRDRELRASVWNFSIKRATLAAHATAPDFTYSYAFPLPTDTLRLLLPPRLGLDWKVEDHEGSPAILTNDGTSLEIRYVAKITDPTKFDALFVEMLACKIAWHLCEVITQSNTKKQGLQAEYADLKREARRSNALERIPEEEAMDSWVAARQQGSIYQSDRSWIVGAGGSGY